MSKLTFHGAARTVTGSKYLLETGGARVLIDAGLFQGEKRLREKNWSPPGFDPRILDAVVLTHAHLDHVGYLPRLVKQGLRCPVYCTPATEKLAELIILDAAEFQERDARYANKKGFTRHKPALPLYDEQDAQRALKQLKVVPRGTWFSPAAPVAMRYHDAGHLLGSNMIEVELRDSDPPLRLLFSGDVGRYDGPLYHDPAEPPPCDYLICESTYGDREHPETDLLSALEGVVDRAVARGGVMLMASFAVGRAQQLIYLLQVLMHEGRIEPLPIYLDSPMSVDATKIFRQHNDDHDLSEGQLSGEQSVLDGKNVHLIRRSDESKALNGFQGPGVIISSSGMMTGGRILHHLKHRLPHESNTVVLGGFMAAGTRGRRLQEGEKVLRIHGRDVPVQAHIEQVSGLSGHADRSDLLRWLEPLADPRRVFLTHGEEESALALASELQSRRGWDVVVPELSQEFKL